MSFKKKTIYVARTDKVIACCFMLVSLFQLIVCIFHARHCLTEVNVIG